MRNIFALSILCFNVFVSKAQMPGDTITVNTFNYGSTTRDTMIAFPNNPSIQYEKVIMLYNMRCKNGLVSPGTAGQTNIGCGEWDYSCNTYITDSTRVDSQATTRPSHVISNFSGTTYPYTTTTPYHLYQFNQTNTVASIVSETQSNVGTGALNFPLVSLNDVSGRHQFLFTQAELTAAGVVAGNIDGFLLQSLQSNLFHFLKIGMKHTSLSSLNTNDVDTTSLFETYHANTNFTAGANRLQFHTPFLWDGVSNILIDLSFTTSNGSNTVQLVGSSVTGVSAVSAANGYFVSTESGITAKIPTASFSSIQNEITVSFWSKGNNGIFTKNTSIIEGVDSSNRRQLNIHHPWSNGRVYFDCGNSGSAYDRIDKQATVTEMEGVWNHWAFTKNATTGIMNIYLNGALWHTGSGKTMPINIDSLALGANIANGNLFDGSMDELCIWNIALSATTIQNWMRTSLTASHPNASNLVAYYKLNESSGSTSADNSSFANTASFSANAEWRFTRGDKLHRFFETSVGRPNFVFLQGNYTLVNTVVQVYDSIAVTPNIVREYTIVPNPGSILNDAYNLVSTNVYWQASYRYVYDGITGVKIDSFSIPSMGSIHITNLPFMNRYPSKFEIMSFVTPYGINLDLGMTGKTWTFDVTDFMPILKGNKRISIERGGEWQENLDIRFLFIVGTPVRDVKDIIQIWRQPVNCNYNQINTDALFEPRSVLLRADGKAFKIRNMITGHGQEGEFIPRTHTMNINGGTEEFAWTLYKKCAKNPVYPQGGTWVYDRCGWCPGMASDLKEMDITQYVTPGMAATIDYHMPAILPSDPAIGTSNYIVTNQLVTYGSLNFSLDAAIVDILTPTNKIEYARENSMCAQPKIRFQNTGSTPITSLLFEYWINDNPVRTSFTWNGNLAPLSIAEIELPNYNLWNGVKTPQNVFHVEVKNPNGALDQYSYNNKMSSSFTVTDIVPSNFIIYHRSNNFATETKYELFDEWGNLLFAKSPTLNNTIYRDTFNLTYGCYKFVVTDTDEDGISWWANSDGAGIIRFQRGNGTILKTFNPDFGASIEYNFTIDFPLKYEDIYPENIIRVYPNPTSNSLFLEADGIEHASISLYDVIGNKVPFSAKTTTNKVQIATEVLPKGMYLADIFLNGTRSNHKIVVE